MKMINFVMRPLMRKQEAHEATGKNAMAAEARILGALKTDGVFTKERAHAAFGGLKKRQR